MRAATDPTSREPNEEPRDREGAWAFPVNETARSDEIEVTLLTFTVMDDLVRMSALVRMGGPSGGRLASIPELIVTQVGREALVPVSAHVLPHGRVAWVSWLFQRPAEILGSYEASVASLQVTSDARRGVPTAPGAALTFRFDLPSAHPEARMLEALSR